MYACKASYCARYMPEKVLIKGVTQISCSCHCIVTKIVKMPNGPLAPKLPELCLIYIQTNSKGSSEFGENQGKVLLSNKINLLSQQQQKERQKEMNVIHIKFVIYWPDTCSITLHYLASLKLNKIFY